MQRMVREAVPASREPWGEKVGDEENTIGSRGFGAYLRRVRESRRLSLDAVEEMSVEFPERVTKSHLSRIENGLALPTFPRLHALGRIYGVPMATMAERYEVEARKASIPTVAARPDEDVKSEARRLRTQGLYQDAMLLYLSLLENGTVPLERYRWVPRGRRRAVRHP